MLCLAGATKVSTGWASSCALLTSGAVDCWGSDHYGQLGNGIQQPSSFPTAVHGLAPAKKVLVGGYSACGPSFPRTSRVLGPGQRGSAWRWQAHGVHDARMVNRARTNGVLESKFVDLADSAIELRNLLSHPKGAAAFTVGMAGQMLEQTHRLTALVLAAAFTEAS